MSGSLGEYLRLARERRGFTLEQVASATKISLRFLQLIEADQYGELPAKPFIRGFVQSYSRFIGLDPQEVLLKFDDYISQKVTSERPVRDAGFSGYAFEKKEGEQSRTVLWAVMATFVFLGAIAVLVLKPSLKQSRKSQVEVLRAAASPSPSPEVSPSPGAAPLLAALPAAVTPVSQASPSAVASPKPSPLPVTPRPVSPSPSPSPSVKPDPLNSGANLQPSLVKHKLVIRALEDVRVRFRSDARPLSSFILRKDRVLVVRAESAIQFQVSNLAGVQYSYNGSGNRPMASAPNLSNRSNGAALIFPVDIVQSAPDEFSGLSALQAPEPPPARPVPPSPTP